LLELLPLCLYYINSAFAHWGLYFEILTRSQRFIVSTGGYAVIGYHHIDAPFALRLATDLRNRGVNVWLDRLDIRLDDDWEGTIRSALSECNLFIAILSPDYVVSDYGKNELAMMDRRNVFTIPLLLRPVSPLDWPSSLNYEQYIDVSAWTDADAYLQIIHQLFNLLSETELIAVQTLIDPEWRYLNTVLYQIEMQKTHFEYVDLSFHIQDSPPNDWRPSLYLEDNWGKQATYLFQSPLGVQLEHNLRELFHNQGHLLLIGQMGFGKTMAMNRLMYDDIQLRRSDNRKLPLPYCLSGADWDVGQSLTGFLKSYWGLRADILTLLQQGGVTLYFDDLHFLNDNQARDLSDWLKSDNAPMQCLLIARDDYAHLHYFDVATVTVTDVLISQAEAMIYQQLRAHRVVSFWEKLEPIEQWDWALSRPLFLQLLSHTYRFSPSAPLPTTPAQLLWRFWEGIWSREQILRNPDWQPWEYSQSTMSTLMNYRDGDYGRLIIPENDLDKVQAMVWAMLKQSGLVHYHGGYYRFIHDRFYPLMRAAQLLSDGLYQHLQRPQLTDDGQRVVRVIDEMFVDALGISDDVHHTVMTIADVDPYLAVKCLAENGITDAVSVPDLIAKVLLFAHQHDQLTAYAPLQALKWLTSDDVVEYLLQTLRMESDLELRQIVYAFICKSDLLFESDAIEFVSTWNGDMTDQVIIQIKDLGRDLIPVLFRAYESAEWQLRRAYIWALGHLQDRASGVLLIQALQSDVSILRREAIIALRFVRDVQAVSLLIPCLNDLDMGVRRATVKTLQAYGTSALPAITRMLNSEDIQAQRVALGVLGKINDPNTIPSIIPFIQHDDVDLRAVAVKILGDMRDPLSIRALATVLNDKSQSRWIEQTISQLAENALHQIGTEDAMRIVNRWLMRKAKATPTSAQQAKAMLTDVGHRRTDEIQAIDDPYSASQHEDWKIRKRALEILAESPQDNAILIVLALLDDEHSQVRWQAVKTLSQFAPQVALEPLARSLQDAEYVIAQEAATIMLGFGKAAVTYLLVALQHDNPDVRYLAIDVLSQLKDRRAVSKLRLLVDDQAMPRIENVTIAHCAKRAIDRIETQLMHDVVVDEDNQDDVFDEPPPQMSSEYTEIEPVVIATDFIIPPDLDDEVVHVPPPNEDEDEDVISESLSDRDEDVSSNIDVLPDEQDRSETFIELVPANPSDTQTMRAILPEVAGFVADLTSSDWRKQQRASKGLVEWVHGLESPEIKAMVAQQLVSLLTSDVQLVRWAIVESFAWLKDSATLPELFPLIHDKSWTVRVSLLRTFLEIEDKRAVPIIQEALNDQNELVREVAAEILGIMGDHSVIPALLAVLQDENNLVKRASIEALGELKATDAIHALIPFIDDADTYLSWVTIIALGNIRSEEAVPHLIPLLDNLDSPSWEIISDDDDQWRVADVVAQSLAQIGTPEALEVLQKRNMI